jgi:CHAT domain-containing protein
LLAGLLAACQSPPPPPDDTVPVEEAKKHKIIYRAAAEPGAYVPPPRTVEDLLAALKAYPDAPNADAAAALVRQAPPKTDDVRKLAAFYWERGRAAQRLGLVQQQIADLRKAAEHGQGISSKDVEGDRILAELAGAEIQGGNLLTALALRRQAIEAAARSKSMGLQMSNSALLAELYSRLGERKLAQAALDEAETLLASLQRSRNWGWYQHNWPTWTNEARAILLEDEGKYQEAESLRRRVLTDREADIEMSKQRLKTAELSGAPSQEAVLRHRGRAETLLALNLVKQERLTEAEAIVRKQLDWALRTRGRYRPGTGNSFLTLSRVLYEEGRYAEARQLADVALDIYTKTGVLPESVFMANARRARAAALAAESRWADAVAEMERMQAGLARDAVLLAQLGRGDLDWALALARTGRAGEAIPMLETMLASARERLGAEHYEVAEIRGFLGLVQVAAGRFEEALRAFHEALPALTIGTDSTDGKQHSPVRVRRLGLVLDAYLNLLTDTRGAAVAQSGGLDPVAEAFRIADLARGQSVQRALSSSAARSAATDPALAALVRREQDASRQISALYDLIANLLSAPLAEQKPDTIARLRQDVMRLSEERKRLFTEIEKRFPDYANLINPKPPTLVQVRSALVPGEVLISIYVGAERSFVWAVPKEGEVAFAAAPLGERQINDMVVKLRKALDPGTAALGAMPAFDLATAHQLYSRLLGPVAHTWKKGDSLLVVPHRALSGLPFVILPTAPATLKADSRLLFGNYRDVPWLARQVAVTQLPSVNALVTLRALPPGDANRRMFAGFGDPLFNREQLAEANAEQQKPLMLAQATTRRLPLRNLKVERVSAPATEETPQKLTVTNSSRLAQVPRLPDTADEIREIAQVLKASDNDDVFLRLRATEEQVKNTNLSNRRVLVFATHGLVPGELDGLNQPALALTAPELTGGKGDGLLTMDEVLGLKLNADWVVLSACNTAAGQGNDGEAISGLGRAFFYAGTRALLVTHWPVETTSARALTTGVFRRQAEDSTLTRAQALRQTMLTLIDSQGYVDPTTNKTVYAYAHPLFWAPYALVGDGGK